MFTRLIGTVARHLRRKRRIRQLDKSSVFVMSSDDFLNHNADHVAVGDVILSSSGYLIVESPAPQNEDTDPVTPSGRYYFVRFVDGIIIRQYALQSTMMHVVDHLKNGITPEWAKELAYFHHRANSIFNSNAHAHLDMVLDSPEGNDPQDAYVCLKPNPSTVIGLSAITLAGRPVLHRADL